MTILSLLPVISQHRRAIKIKYIPGIPEGMQTRTYIQDWKNYVF